MSNHGVTIHETISGEQVLRLILEDILSYISVKRNLQTKKCIFVDQCRYTNIRVPLEKKANINYEFV